MNPTILSVISAMAAAAWSVWLWQSEQQKTRELKRDEMSAQYVNTFIVVTQELQRKLFRILEEDELARYKLKYAQPVEPASPMAIDLLYHLSGFFGWGLMTFRFGPYTRDSKMISMLAQTGEILESRSRFPGDAFCFTLADRMELGQSVLRRVGETSSGPTFVTIPRFKFEQEIKDEQSEWAKLFRSDQVRCTLAAIDRAVAGERLEGRERLAAFQNLLVDLVSYLEHQEGFRISLGERRRATVQKSHAEVVSLPSKEIRILHQMPGRVRLGMPRLHADRSYACHLESLLQTVSHVESVRVNVAAACVVVEYSADVEPEALIQKVVAKVESDFGGSSGNDSVLSSHRLVDHRA